MTDRQREIVEAWDRIEDAEPGILTGFLFLKVQEETGATTQEITDSIIAYVREKYGRPRHEAPGL